MERGGRGRCEKGSDEDVGDNETRVGQWKRQRQASLSRGLGWYFDDVGIEMCSSAHSGSVKGPGPLVLDNGRCDRYRRSFDCCGLRIVWCQVRSDGRQQALEVGEPKWIDSELEAEVDFAQQPQEQSEGEEVAWVSRCMSFDVRRRSRRASQPWVA